jgi:fructose-1,6-bisphosphatase
MTDQEKAAIAGGDLNDKFSQIFRQNLKKEEEEQKEKKNNNNDKEVLWIGTFSSYYFSLQ